jgi:hypothetical protein
MIPHQLPAARARVPEALHPVPEALHLAMAPPPPRRRAQRTPWAPRRWRVAAETAPPSPPAAGDLAQLGALLASGREGEAVALAAALREAGALRAFGRAAGVPKRAYTMEELRLNKIETKDFLAPEDATLNGVRTAAQAAFAAGALAAGAALHATPSSALPWAVGALALLTADQVGNGGGVEALLVDAAGRVLSPTYARRVALHEAGHFLVAYLLGLLPRGYTLSAWDAFAAERSLNIQAGTTFCDAAFQKEVASGRLSSGSLDVYSCVALAGVATEWLRFGRAEGGLSDVQQLDGLLRALGFTQAKADSQVRWAVLNVVTLLRRHQGAHDALADAMSRRAPVGECVRTLERAPAGAADI